MGIDTYHTLFAATEADLDRLFPGWKHSRPEKTLREGINPFTKEVQVVALWEPVEDPEPLGSPSYRDDVWGPSTQPIGLSAKHREDSAPPGLLALPHFCAENLSMRFIDNLVRRAFRRRSTRSARAPR